MSEVPLFNAAVLAEIKAFLPVQKYLTDKQQPICLGPLHPLPLGPLQGPGNSPAVGSLVGAASYERVTPIGA